MEDDRKEKNSPWLSVPQFGDWDQKGQLPDYSMDFSKIRERRQQNKRDPSRASHGNEENLISLNTRDFNKPHDDDHLHNHQNNSPTTLIERKRRYMMESSDVMNHALGCR